MPDRKKVIYALECLSLKSEIKAGRCICDECAYEEASESFIDCVHRVSADALELLKEQEPKVLTREELKQFVGHPCWFESCGTYMGKEGFWIIPSMFRTFYGGEIVSYVSVLMKNSDYGMADHSELGLSAYNKVWRCWSSRPTDEQRKAVKWDE